MIDRRCIYSQAAHRVGPPYGMLIIIISRMCFEGGESRIVLFAGRSTGKIVHRFEKIIASGLQLRLIFIGQTQEDHLPIKNFSFYKPVDFTSEFDFSVDSSEFGPVTEIRYVDRDSDGNKIIAVIIAIV